jgi:hypothetical protein
MDRVDKDWKSRTWVTGVFRNKEAPRGPVRSILMDISEEGVTGRRYLLWSRNDQARRQNPGKYRKPETLSRPPPELKCLTDGL